MLKQLIKTHNSRVSASELAEALDMQDIPYEYADTGLWVSVDDAGYAESLLAEMEMNAEEDY